MTALGQAASEAMERLQGTYQNHMNRLQGPYLNHHMKNLQRLHSRQAPCSQSLRSSFRMSDCISDRRLRHSFRRRSTLLSVQEVRKPVQNKMMNLMKFSEQAAYKAQYELNYHFWMKRLVQKSSALCSLPLKQELELVLVQEPVRCNSALCSLLPKQVLEQVPVRYSSVLYNPPLKQEQVPVLVQEQVSLEPGPVQEQVPLALAAYMAPNGSHRLKMPQEQLL